MENPDSWNAANNPYWQKGGADNDSKAWLYDYFSKTFGRAPTQDELAQFAPIYRGSDPNITDVAQGNAAVARYHQQQNPTDQYAAEVPKQADAINALFQQHLGRQATPEELNHFGTLLASKQYDAYTLGQVLETLPENVKKQDAAFRDQLSGDLQKQDAQYYNEQVMPGIAQNFAKQGRSFDSSAYAQALAQAAQGQNRQREGFLSNLSASQYGNSQANARADYLGNYAYNRDRSNQLADANTSRLNEISNFNMQKQAYDQYLARYGKKNSWVNDLGTGLNFANAAMNLGRGGANAFGGSGGGGGGSPMALPYGQV